jgi:hypothetical protein
LIQTLDGGFALAGCFDNFNLSSISGERDMWLVKTDASGNVTWQQTYGGTDRDTAFCLVQTLDGGFVLMGVTRSYGAGKRDMWLVKTDASGNVIWQHTFGGAGYDEGRAVIQTHDGGYAVVGKTSSYGTGGDDMWLVKTDANGGVQWQQTFGGFSDDEGNAIIQTDDGGFILAGGSDSLIDGSGHQIDGGDGGWLVKTDANGVMIWDQTYGDTKIKDCWIKDLVQTIDGGFALVGNTEESCWSRENIWLMKTEANGNVTWQQTYGGREAEWGAAVIQTVDGGFALVGHTNSFGAGGEHMWLVKTDANGGIQWHQTYGGFDAQDLVQTTDGGFALVGSFDLGIDYIGEDMADYCDVDMCLVKTDVNGLVQTSDLDRWLVGSNSSSDTEGIWVDFSEEGRSSNMSFVKTDANVTIQSSSITTTPSSTPTPGWGLVPLLIAIVVLATWHRRKLK